jgi:hypothetical protein
MDTWEKIASQGKGGNPRLAKEENARPSITEVVHLLPWRVVPGDKRSVLPEQNHRECHDIFYIKALRVSFS